MHKVLLKGFLFSTFILSCFPILSFGMRSVATGVWALLGILLFMRTPKEERPRIDRQVLIFVIPYFTLGISLLYSENTTAGLDLLQKMLTFLIVPFVWILNQKSATKKHIQTSLYLFIGAVFLLVVYQLGHVLVDASTLFGELTNAELKANGIQTLSEINQEKVAQIKVRRFRNYVIKLTRSHTTYQGLWLVFCLFFIGQQFKTMKKKISPVFIGLIVLVLLTWLLLISPRMPILAGILAAVGTLFLFSKITTKAKIGFTVVLGILLTSVLLVKNPVSTRLQEYYHTGFAMLQNEQNIAQYNSANVRNGIYYCDTQLLKQHFGFGFGIGDVQDQLNQCYQEELSAKIYSWQTYNTHNQYVFFWLASGLAGLLSFLLLIVWFFRRAIKKKHSLLFYTTTVVGMVFLTENLLERSDGVLFFSFILMMLFIQQKQERTN